MNTHTHELGAAQTVAAFVYILKMKIQSANDYKTECNLNNQTICTLMYPLRDHALPRLYTITAYHGLANHMNACMQCKLSTYPSSGLLTTASLPLLTHLDLSGNNLSGPILPAFANFPKLQSLSLVNNLLTSSLPSFLSNVSTLQELNLSCNPFSPGPFPPSYGNLSSLRVLWLTGCNLIGPIPPSLGLLSSLTDLDLSYNALSGNIPRELLNLRSAVQIELYANGLTGPVPAGFSNIAALRFIDFAMNNLSRVIPDELGRLDLHNNLISG